MYCLNSSHTLFKILANVIINPCSVSCCTGHHYKKKYHLDRLHIPALTQNYNNTHEHESPDKFAYVQASLYVLTVC